MKILVILFSIFALTTMSQPIAHAKEYFPADHWRTSTPEAQGISSGNLTAILNNMARLTNDYHSILVIRNGYAVMEAYFPPYTGTNRHHLYSATKSVLSALVGIAIDEGKMKSVQEKVSVYFPEWRKPGTDPRKSEITVADLLSMRSGLKWEYTDDDIWYNHRIPRLTDYILGRPMINRPGNDFLYNTGNSQLLAAIIQKVTGKKASEYAAEKLFRPLGITDFEWKTTDDGFTYGGTLLYMKPSDMAKIGYLYLMKGKWGNKQVVSTNWVVESTSSKSAPCWASYDRPYSYHWWNQNFPGYSARGAFGQCIYVIPEAKLVVVTTGAIPIGEMWDTTDKLVSSLLAKLSQNNKVLPENPGAYSYYMKTLLESTNRQAKK